MKKVFLVLGLVFLTSCATKETEPHLQSIHLHDRNGFQETISSADRLAPYEHTDFERPQGYEKVIRSYARDAEGAAKSIITTYHSNGLIKQSLTCINSRARGDYKEFYENGYPKVEATVIEGIADVTEEAKGTWVFDGVSKAWSENGALSARIEYTKGKLTGDAFYYHTNGEIEKKVPYEDGKIHGMVRQYDESGTQLGIYTYVYGQKEGKSLFKGTKESPPFVEEYKNGMLVTGEYRDFSEKVISFVYNGCGTRVLYKSGELQAKQTIEDGRVEGECFEYKDGRMHTAYFLRSGKKHGLETLYFDDGAPKLAINWVDGVVQGQSKTWYPNGSVQSEVTLHDNMKHGMSVAWYEDGALMHVEEYKKGILQTGKYFTKGEEQSPISIIDQGKGFAHLFDQQGTLIEKVKYEDGLPVEE